MKPKIRAGTGINIVGNIFGNTGYASHTRSLANALYAEDPNVHLATQLPAGWELAVNDQELSMIRKARYHDGVTIMIAQPEQWLSEINAHHKTFVGFAVWEGDRVPIHWKKPLREADYIFVPSQHVYDAIKATFPDDNFHNKTHIIPHGVDSDKFRPRNKPEKVRFFANKGWRDTHRDRGGLQFLIKAFCEEFTEKDHVELCIKINTSYCGPGWNLQTELDKLDLPKKRLPLYITTDMVDASALPAMYEGHWFVTTSMAEAFNLPCLEGLSSGMPVITTDYGGQLDFCNEKNSLLIESNWYENDWEIPYEGIQWRKPKHEDIKLQLRQAYKIAMQRPKLYATMVDEARKTGIEWSWKSTAKKIHDAIGVHL